MERKQPLLEGSGQIMVPAATLEGIKSWAQKIGLNIDEAVDLFTRASPVGLHTPGVSIAEQQLTISILERLDGLSAIEPEKFSSDLRDLGVREDVIGVRLGSRRASDHDPDAPLQRVTVGANLTDGIADIWSAARGFWKHTGVSRIVVPLRMGKPLAVFSRVTWMEYDDRRYLASGEIIRDGRRLSTAEGTPVIGAATDEETAIEKLVMSHLIRTPARSRNPVIWLARRQ